MTIDLTCQACDSSFELDVAELLDEPKLQCPGCDTRAPRSLAEGLAAALEDLLAQAERLGSRFSLVLQVDSDDLPSHLDRRRASEDEEEEDLARDDLGDDQD